MKAVLLLAEMMKSLPQREMAEMVPTTVFVQTMALCRHDLNQHLDWSGNEITYPCWN